MLTKGKDSERKAYAALLHVGIALLVIITSAVDFVPFAPSFPNVSLDSGWSYALNVALARGFIFGHDIVFTFGPYASIYTEQYLPATDTLMLCSSGLLALAFAACLLCLTQGFCRLVALGFTIFLILVFRDAQLFAIPFVALVLVCRVAMPVNHPAHIALVIPVKLSLALMVVALGLLSLSKGNLFVGATAIMVLGCTLLFIQGQKALSLSGAVLFVVTICVLWMIAGQPLMWLPHFFIAQGPVISGYAAAMSIGGPIWQIMLFAACSLLLGILCAWMLYAAGIAGVFLLIGAAALLFLAFKEGYVRDDGHSIIAGGVLGVAGWIMLLSRRGFIPFAGLIVGLAGWLLISLPPATGNQSDIRATGGVILNDISSSFSGAGHGIITRLTDPAAFDRIFKANLLAISTEKPLPRLAGTTDIYSFGQSVLLANGLDWNPRPLIQSYTAYTPSLAKIDADHLIGANAPDNILFTLQTIDGRLPALDDSASWPALFTRYDITGIANDMAILRKRAVPLAEPIPGAPFVSGAFNLGEQVPLPANVPVIWAVIDVKPTLLGRLVGLAFKPPHLNIAYLFPDGSVQTFRYIAGMGASGFVAAPLVERTTDFAALALPDTADFFAHRRPEALVITSDHGAGWLWRRAVQVKLYAAHFPAQPLLSNLLFAPLASSQFISAAEILPGQTIVQSFKPPSRHFDGLAVSFVNWGRTPSHYVINWRIEAGQADLGSGQIDASTIADWQHIDLPLATLPNEPPDEIKLTLWVAPGTLPAIPAGLPLYRPLSGGTDPAVEISGAPAAGGAQLGVTAYVR